MKTMDPLLHSGSKNGRKPVAMVYRLRFFEIFSLVSRPFTGGQSSQGLHVMRSNANAFQVQTVELKIIHLLYDWIINAGILVVPSLLLTVNSVPWNTLRLRTSTLAHAASSSLYNIVTLGERQAIVSTSRQRHGTTSSKTIALILLSCVIAISARTPRSRPDRNNIIVDVLSKRAFQLVVWIPLRVFFYFVIERTILHINLPDLQ